MLDFFIVCSICIILLLSIGLVCFLVSQNNKKYRDFVSVHSLAVQRLHKINVKYVFSRVSPHMNMHNVYDNESMYDDISPRDYLIYQLVYCQRDVREQLKTAAYNRELYAAYRKEIHDACVYGEYDAEVTLRNPDKLLKEEKKCFHSNLQCPILNFSIVVELWLTDINGRYHRNKVWRFSETDIEEILTCMAQKHGDYYLDGEIWNAICRVERGKVSNRMRFAIYQRDGYRCRKCGRSSNDLEIDHIFPISKGGKSVFDNLQTLCHRCNTEKSNTVEAGAIIPRRANATSERICQNCGVPLVLRHGRNGSFYGCMNYPNCRYTEKI